MSEYYVCSKTGLISRDDAKTSYEDVSQTIDPTRERNEKINFNFLL